MSMCRSVVTPGKGSPFPGVLATLILCAGAAHAADWLTPSDMPTRQVAFGQRAQITPLDAARARARDLIELQTFLSLPPDVKRLVIEAGAAPDLYERNEFDDRVVAEHGETPYEDLASIISRDTYDMMRPVHRHMLKTLMQTTRERGPVVSLCFTPGTPNAVVQAFEDAVFGSIEDEGRFQLTSRWTTSAMGEPSYAQGEPIRLTYSFVPDGTFVPNLIGAQGNSQLFAFLNGIYGSPDVWQPIYAQVWAHWASISGLEYVLEPNDDGVALNDNPGIVGVRGDLRMAAIPIDGNSGTLAYNNFPNDGDMVLDAFDSFYNNTANNSVRLRNILAHEHGHGQGLFHVCPREENKLMEPYITVLFDGAQFDDQLASQRHYGDNSEPSDTPGQATPLGAFTGTPINRNLMSIDDNTDVDYFAFTVAAPTAVAVTATPAQRDAYLQGPQNSGCTGGALFDPGVVHDLKIDVLAGDGVTVLDSVDATGYGDAETAIAAIAAPGTYYIRVRGSSDNNIQRYALNLENAPSTIRLATGVDEFNAPSASLELSLDAFSSAGDAIVPGSVTLHYRLDAGAFQDVVMSPAGPNAYTASIPAISCGDTPEFYFSAMTVGGATLLDPPAGAGDPYSFTVGELMVAVDDDFETDTGWTVTGNATTGQWQRGVPVNDGQGDPVSDFDGSGRCWLTQNQDGNTDVDNGSTILTSPVYDASAGVRLSYAYWINSGPGAIDGDSVTLQVATDPAGTNWMTVRSHTTESDDWRTESVAIGDGGAIPATATLRLRFTATDGGTPSYLEAAIDALLIETLSCVDLVGCTGDTNGDNLVNFADLNTVLGAFGQTGENIPADLNGDGSVNFADLNAVLANFSLSCR